MKFDLDLKVISDSDLLAATKCLASDERRIGIEVLHHLREIDARKLFASLGFSSLFSYCTTELGYSEGGSYRRIAAMRLLREVPEYETKLEKGEVSVATLSQVQSFLVQEKRQLGKTYSAEGKLELLAKVEGKSAHQTERVLATISPQLVRDERARVIDEEKTEIRFTADRELMEKMDRLKDLLGHKTEAQSDAGLIAELADIAIEKLDPQERVTWKKKRSEGLEKPETAGATKFIGPSLPSASLPPVEVGQQRQERDAQGNGHAANLEGNKYPEANKYEDKKVVTRYIPVKTRQAVWRRDDGRCTFVSPSTGRRCDSRHAQIFRWLKLYSF